MYDIIIIGAGPAGLCAAIYAQRAARKVLVLEANNYGGQIIEACKVENYPAEPNISGAELAKKLYTQAKDLGATIEFEQVVDIYRDGASFVVKTEDDQYEARAVIIATGTKNRGLGLEREGELIGKGISFCATCDGALYKGKDVAVVGGGNTALHDALYLSNICKKVYLIHRRNEFRGDQSDVERLKALDNVEFLLESEVEAYIGDDKLAGLNIKQSDKTFAIQVDALFLAVGREANAGFCSNLGLNLDNGYVDASEDCTTNVPGIFVAGDVRTKALRQLVTATADGAIAATNASSYIDEIDSVISDRVLLQNIYNVGALLLDFGRLSIEAIARILSIEQSDAEQTIESMKRLGYLRTDVSYLEMRISNVDALKLSSEIDTDTVRTLIKNERNRRNDLFPNEEKIA